MTIIWLTWLYYLLLTSSSISCSLTCYFSHSSSSSNSFLLKRTKNKKQKILHEHNPCTPLYSVPSIYYWPSTYSPHQMIKKYKKHRIYYKHLFCNVFSCCYSKQRSEHWQFLSLSLYVLTYFHTENNKKKKKKHTAFIK